MKKLILSLALLAGLSGVVQAQTEKGSWALGGTSKLGFSSVNTQFKSNGVSVDAGTVSSFNITPSASYFIADNLALGANVGFTSTKSGTDRSTSLVIMPDISYFFTKSQLVKPYLTAGIGLASLSNSSAGITLTNTGLAWELDAGIVYFITKQVALNLGVGYGQISYKENLPSGNNTYTVNHNTFGSNIGLAFFLK